MGETSRISNIFLGRFGTVSETRSQSVSSASKLIVLKFWYSNYHAVIIDELDENTIAEKSSLSTKQVSPPHESAISMS